MDDRLVVISPVRNEAAHIERVVRAMAFQTVRPVLWLVVDDASTDGTREKLEAAMPDVDPGVRPVLAETAARLAPSLPGGTVYTDDKAPVEWLIDRSIVEYAARGGR